MNEYIKGYLSFFSCKVTAGTLERVKVQLLSFITYTRDNGASSVSQVEPSHIIRWSAWLREKGLKPISLCSYHSALKGFLNWLHREGYLLVNPFPEGLALRYKDYIPKAFPNINQTREFLENVDDGQSGPGKMFPDRNRAILELAYGSGLRRGELHRLNVGQIQGDWLKVLGKGNKERLVPLGAKAKAAVNGYIRGERQRLLEKYNPLEEALYLGQRGTRLSPAAFSYIVRNIRPAGAKWTLHSFRHACATHMLENGASIRVIQKLLGHGKLSSTQLYTHVEVSSLRKVLQNHHPRG